MKDFAFLLPIGFMVLFWALIVFFIFKRFNRKKNKKTTMQDFVKNPFGNIFNVALGSISQASSLDTAFQNVLANPCQQTADALLSELNNVDDIFKFGMSSGRGINTALWKNTFNEYIVPSKNICVETKQKIREALISLSVDRLHKVVDTDAIGAAAEENVWFTLSQIASRGKYNIFYDIRIPYTSISQGSQQIDNIIVCSKGVFLIEVKSVGSATQNHSQQIGMHETAFSQNFANVACKSLLVISCPRGQYVTIDSSTIPTSSLYTSLTVDNLYEHIIAYDGPDVLDDATIDFVTQKLKTFVNYNDGVASTKWIINGNLGKPETKLQENVCPNCKNALTANSPFCPYCGTKL